jgi:hypothetical protein
MDIIYVILFILLFNAYFIKVIAGRVSNVRESYLWILFAVHFLLTCAYLFYAAQSRSDSVSYYLNTSDTPNWLDLFQTSTKFIGFLSWPFINILGLTYYAVMILFSYFGYIAVVLFYLTAKENIVLPLAWNDFTATELVFLLPNLHFWSSSLGKGSNILLGLAMVAYGLSRFNRRLITILAGSFLVYMIRPHIILAVVVSVAIGIFLTRRGIGKVYKWIIFVIAIAAFYYMSDQVLKFTESDSFDITSSDALSHRVSELSKASSGVDIQNYNIVFKLFTFWFRPLFVDGLGALGLIVSFENLICLIMFIYLIRFGIKSWGNWNGYFRIVVFIFLLGSFMLAQVSGNLGIALRQKAQFMPFFFILFCKAMYYRDQSKLAR